MMSRMKRSEVQVSEVTPPMLGKLGSNGGEELKAGNRDKKQTSKLGQQRWWSWDTKGTALRHALEWRRCDSSHGWKEGFQGRLAMVVN